MAGETLTLNPAQMEKAYLDQNTRGLEVTRTVCLTEVYAGQEKSFLVSGGSSTGAGTINNGITLKNDRLEATITLSDLAIDKDYVAGLGSLRRIKGKQQALALSLNDIILQIRYSIQS